MEYWRNLSKLRFFIYSASICRTLRQDYYQTSKKKFNPQRRHILLQFHHQAVVALRTSDELVGVGLVRSLLRE